MAVIFTRGSGLGAEPRGLGATVCSPRLTGPQRAPVQCWREMKMFEADTETTPFYKQVLMN